MNVTKPEKTHYSSKDKIVYSVAVLICLISVIAIIYIEISQNTSIIAMLNATEVERKKLGKKSEEEIEALKAEINNKFNNTMEKKSVSSNIKKLDSSKDLVFTDFTKKDSNQNNYEINVILPYINIDSELVKEYNQEIQQIFKGELDAVLQTENKNVIYSTEYVASVNNNVLSLMIRANLKEGTNAQRTIIKTYNYDVKEDREITLKEMLDNNNLDNKKIQKQIKTEIENSQQKVESLKELGYTIYSRNSEDERYLIENSKQFYCTSNTIYIVYAYGNDDFTSETDVIII